jgi:hypothetical protein
MPGGHFRGPDPRRPARVAVLEDHVAAPLGLLVRQPVHRRGGEGGEDALHRAGREAGEGARVDAG